MKMRSDSFLWAAALAAAFGFNHGIRAQTDGGSLAAPRQATAQPRNDSTTKGQPPAIRLNEPAEGTLFQTPADISLRAYGQDAEDGYNLKVEFFEGSRRLGQGVFVPAMCPAPYCPFYALVWSNAPIGQYALSAVATDSQGLSATSAPVHIAVAAKPLPVVSIVATDPEAREMPPMLPAFDPAVFTVSRAGSTNDSLLIFYSIGGTADNGVDYARLSGEVKIPAGARDTQIEVLPISDNLAENTETVILTLVHSTLSPYQVGSPGQATALIRDADVPPTNRPPSVRLAAPADGSVYVAPAAIVIQAVTVDPDGYANKVEFFANARKIGEQEIVFIKEPNPGTPINFAFTWPNVAAGQYELTARTRDNLGAPGVSEPVRIAVLTPEVPPPSRLPVVTIAAADPFAMEGLICFGAGSIWGSNVWGTTAVMSGANYLCIPNTASFRVRRTGETNADLTVFYQVSGTASNGVDYELLPGLVTIPAGKRSATITVVPTDDNVPENVETVILSLQLPPTASPLPPPYQIGYPHNAAAFILDNDHPRPATAVFPGRLFHLKLAATNGFCYRLDWSTNLVTWTAISTNTVTKGALHFVDAEADSALHRFYRAVPVPCASTDD